MKKIVLVTGGFDPIHSGHIAFFNAAKDLGDELVVGLNSDNWLTRKKGRPFMPFNERLEVVKNLKMVDRVISFDDKDDTACHAIFYMMSTTGSDSEIIFANGGDRTNNSTPEYDMYKNHYGVSFEFGIGGEDKKNSSSWILDEWKQPKTQRIWGYYRVLHENGPGVKVKELTVDPGKSLSMQRHQKRAEHWFVSEGEASVYTLDSSTDMELRGKYKLHESLHIGTKEWHMLANETDKPLKIVEIQYGEECVEEDIERRHN
jgi:cytidyltransferase-like protein